MPTNTPQTTDAARADIPAAQLTAKFLLNQRGARSDFTT